MANTAYFDPAVGGTGLTVTDDGNPTTGLDNDGHRERLVPAFSNVVQVAKFVVDTACDISDDAIAAQQAVVDAQGYAQDAATSALEAQQIVLNGAAIVPNWITGQSWAYGQLLLSPSDGKIYRKITPISVSSTDPSLDSVHWEVVNPDPTMPESFTLAQAQATALCF